MVLVLKNGDNSQPPRGNTERGFFSSLFLIILSFVCCLEILPFVTHFAIPFRL
jgi:hypothetical protein